VRRECERYAQLLVAEKPGAPPPPDFNSEEEKDAVSSVFNSAMQCLSEEDRELPFIQRMLPMLRRGIAVHHSGAQTGVLPPGGMLGL
jgi:ATP-dependent RNA helicase DOB1